MIALLLLLACRAADCEVKKRDCEITCATHDAEWVSADNVVNGRVVCWCRVPAIPTTMWAEDPLLPYGCDGREVTE